MLKRRIGFGGMQQATYHFDGFSTRQAFLADHHERIPELDDLYQLTAVLFQDGQRRFLQSSHAEQNASRVASPFALPVGHLIETGHNDNITVIQIEFERT